MAVMLYVVLALLVPVALGGLPLGLWLLRRDSEWDRLEALAVCAIGTVALGATAVVAAVLAATERVRSP